jgi:hypothetical protein
MFQLLGNLSLVDGTHDQDTQRLRVKKWSLDRRFMSSVDMSNATDRFPALAIAFILYLVGLLTLLEAISWYCVMTKRVFTYAYHYNKSLKHTSIKHVKYSIGQPMGILSSWAGFAIAHHFIVQLSAYKAGYRVLKTPLLYFTDYAILGDDIVIADEAVVKNYKTILKLLGVEYSLPKSWEVTGVAEFAKSLFSGGVDLSGLPQGLMSFNWRYINIDVILLF